MINSAQKAVCVTNMRGIGNAVPGYAVDYNNRLPGPLNTGQTAGFNGAYPKGSMPGISRYIGTYLQGNIEWQAGQSVTLRNFGCPSLLKRIPKDRNLASVLVYWITGNNELLKNVGSKGLPWGYASLTPPLPWSLEEFDPMSAGKVIGIIGNDASMLPNPWGNEPSRPAHGNQRMALYFDWSVKPVKVSAWK